MRHGKKLNHLGRKSGHRKAMLSNMACSLIEHKKINTTVAKAKALKLYVEPLITKAKTDSTHSRRTVFSYLKSKEAVTELFRDVAVKVADRPGGYTRILKTGNRIGDNAEMCLIELVDYNDNMLKDVKKKAASTRRRKPSAKKADGATEVEVKEVVEETKVAAAEEPTIEDSTDAAIEDSTENTAEDTSNEEEKKD